MPIYKPLLLFLLLIGSTQCRIINFDLLGVQEQPDDPPPNSVEEKVIEPEWKRALEAVIRSRRAISQQIPPQEEDPAKLSNVFLVGSAFTPPAPVGLNTSSSSGNGSVSTFGAPINASLAAESGDGIEQRSGPIPPPPGAPLCYEPQIDPVPGPNGELKLRYEYNDLPPCPLTGPIEDEPIPYADYMGTKGHGEECKLHYIVNDEQVKGYSPAGGYQTTTGIYDKNMLGSPDHTLNLKISKIESDTCDQGRGLECFPTVPDYFDEQGLLVGGTGVCKCMAGFGRDSDKRLLIEGRCYIPAGMGRHSECITDVLGMPLPSGDPVYEPKTWNKVRLNCTPNSVCVEHHYWIEKRCACKKYSVLDPVTGTCSGQEWAGVRGARLLIGMLGLALSFLIVFST